MANEASPAKTTKVWYSLSDCIDSVKVTSDADIADFRKAIISENPPLQSLSPGTIDIYKPGTISFEPQNVLDPGDVVPNDTSSNARNGKGPLIVVPQQQQQRDGKLRCCSRTQCACRSNIDLSCILTSVSHNSHQQTGPWCLNVRGFYRRIGMDKPQASNAFNQRTMPCSTTFSTGGHRFPASRNMISPLFFFST